MRKPVVVGGAIAILGVLLAVRGLVGTGTVQAQLPWPTPPPAPSGQPLTFIPASEVVSVGAVQKPGSVAAVINPVWAGPLPRIPPLPSTPFITSEPDSEERVQILIEAGTVPITFQMTYEPLGAAEAPRPLPGQQLRRAFWLRTFDYLGKETPFKFARPVKVLAKLRQQDMEAAGGDPGHLYVERWDEKASTWTPLVTAVDLRERVVAIRILSPGLFALIAEPAPVPAPAG